MNVANIVKCRLFFLFVFCPFLGQKVTLARCGIIFGSIQCIAQIVLSVCPGFIQGDGFSVLGFCSNVFLVFMGCIALYDKVICLFLLCKKIDRYPKSEKQILHFHSSDLFSLNRFSLEIHFVWVSNKKTSIKIKRNPANKKAWKRSL